MNLYEMEELEQYKLDKENLISFQEHMDNRLNDRLDKIHMNFLDEYLRSKDNDKLTKDECYLIRKVFIYIKQNM